MQRDICIDRATVMLRRYVEIDYYTRGRVSVHRQRVMEAHYRKNIVAPRGTAREIMEIIYAIVESTGRKGDTYSKPRLNAAFLTIDLYTMHENTHTAENTCPHVISRNFSHYWNIRSYSACLPDQWKRLLFSENRTEICQTYISIQFWRNKRNNGI